jgi:hypothetical protein
MATFGVGFKLTADASQFQREMREAVDAGKKVKSTFETIGISLGPGIGLALLARSFINLANAAQQARDEARAAGMEIDKSVESVAAFGDGLDSLKKGVVNFGIEALSIFTRVGEELGRGWLTWTEGATAQSAKAAENISRDAEENIKRIAAARAKFLADEAKNIEAAEAKIAQIREARAMKEMDSEQRLQKLLAERETISTQLAATDEKSLKARQLRVQIEESLTKEAELRAQMEKQAAEEDAKTQKAISEVEQQREKNQERILALKYQALPPEQKIAQLTKEQADLVSGIARLKQAGQDTSALEVLLLEKQAELATLRLGVEKELTAEGEKQAVAEERKAKAKSAFGLGPIRTSAQFGESSDEALRQLAQANRQLANEIRNPALGGGTFNNGEAARLEFEARNAENEIRFRESLRRDFQLGGEDLARRNFKGDPLAFDAVFARFVDDARDSKEIAREQTDQLKDLNERLRRAGFGK